MDNFKKKWLLAAITLDIVWWSVLLSAPVAGRLQSAECAPGGKPKDCLENIGRCMKLVIGNITEMSKEMAKTSLDNLATGTGIRKPRDIGYSITGGIDNLKQTKKVFDDLFKPLLRMATASTKSVFSGQPDEVMANAVVSNLEILRNMMKNTDLRQNEYVTKLMAPVISRLKKINTGLICGTRTVGGPQALLFLPIQYGAGIVLMYLERCFSMIDQSGLCKLFDKVVILSLDIAIKLVPRAMKIVTKMPKIKLL